MLIYIAILTLIEIVLFAFNYKPGTWLMGWDVVMPELNTWLNIKRSLTAVWQGYRGLGLMDGMAHSANLTHSIYIWFLSIIVPQSAIRYVFIHLTHLAGGLGMFFLLLRFTKNKLSALIGSLFYMLNIGIIQMYSTPLEVFAIHFSALPILTLWTLKSLEEPTRKNLSLLLLFSFLLSGQSFVPTVFLAYLALIFSVLIVNTLKTKKVKTALVVGGVILAANAFWLIPYTYGIPSNSAIIQKARINQFSSEEIFYRNKSFGDLKSVLGLNGFIIDSVEYDITKDQNTYLMQSWRNYQQTLFYVVSYLAFLGTAIFGVYSAIKKKQTEVLSIGLAGSVAFFFLANNTIVLEQLNGLIRWILPTVGEAFRFPFTKFITLFSFSLSVFVGFGFVRLLEIAKRINVKVIVPVVIGLITLGISFPVFTSGLIPSVMKPKLPAGYTEMISYMNTLPEDRRTLVLPAQTFWNWGYRKWGYRGSDFLWYGIKQPLLMRAFDPWSSYNEQFYNELSYAMGTENHQLFNDVVEKYRIKYVLLDESFRNTISSKPVNYQKINEFLVDTGTVVLKKQAKPLVLYEVKNTPNARFFMLKNPAGIPTNFSYTQTDKVYSSTRGYIATPQGSTIFPLPSLYTGKLQTDNEFRVEEQGESLVISKEYSAPSHIQQDARLTIPSYLNGEHLIPTRFTQKGNQLLLSFVYPQISLNDQDLTVDGEKYTIPLSSGEAVQKIAITNTGQEILLGSIAYLQNNTENTVKITYPSSSELTSLDLTNQKGADHSLSLTETDLKKIKITLPIIKSPFTYAPVDPKTYDIKLNSQEYSPTKKGLSFAKSKKSNEGVAFSVRSSSADLAIYTEGLDHRASFLLIAKAQNKSGLPVHFYVDNPFEKRPELESRLSKTITDNVFVIPPSQKYFKGYGFHFITKSLGTEIAENIIGPISIYPVPLDLLTGLKIQNVDEPKNATYVTNNQAYHPGWIAFQVAGFKVQFLKDHVLVNNWENGWKVPTSSRLQDSSYKFVFWPQHLEYLGFALMLGAGLYIWKKQA